MVFTQEKFSNYDYNYNPTGTQLALIVEVATIIFKGTVPRDF
jgi:hypothetical protein